MDYTNGNRRNQSKMCTSVNGFISANIEFVLNKLNCSQIRVGLLLKFKKVSISFRKHMENVIILCLSAISFTFYWKRKYFCVMRLNQIRKQIYRKSILCPGLFERVHISIIREYNALYFNQMETMAKLYTWNKIHELNCATQNCSIYFPKLNVSNAWNLV